eukprot:scaffold176901_cov31-Tisochrysis_lutea.AAC.1
MVGSGEKVIRVPVELASSTGSGLTDIGSTTSPLEKPIRCSWPARRTSAVSESDSALTTETPTPCRPPETLYPEPPPPNFPPACSTVSTVSSAGLPVLACTSHGMPRPSSETERCPCPAGERLIDRVVDHLKHQVVQPAHARRAYVHAWPLADRLQSLQNCDLLCTVACGDGGRAGERRSSARARPTCAAPCHSPRATRP